MSGINLYNRNLDAFVQFAQNSIDSTDKNSRKQAAVSRIVSEAGKPLEIEEATDDSRYSLRFSQRLKDKNNEARDAFIDALIEQFGSYEAIPESVREKMKETDYAFAGNDHHSTSGKPLSAERISKVDQAIRDDAKAHPGKYAGISLFVTLKDAMKDKNPDKQEYINKLATCVVNLFKGLNIDGNTKIPLAGNQGESRSLDEVFQCFLTRPYADNRQAGIAMLASVFSTLVKQLREKCNDYSVDSQEMTESLMQHGTARTAFKEFEDRITTFLEDKSVIMSLESEDKSTFPPLEIDIDSIFASLEKINNQNGQTEDQKKAEMRTMLRDVITQIQDIPYAQRDSDIDNMLAPFSFDKTNRFSSQVKFVYVLNKLYTRLDATLKRLKNPPFGLPTMYKRLNQEKLQQYLDVFRNKLEEYIQRGGESLRNRLKDFAAEYVNDELNNENWWNDNETDFKDINEAWKDLDKKIKQENGNQAEETAIKTRLETLAKEIEEESQNSTSVADSKTLSKITSAFCLLPELTPFNNPYYKDLLINYKPCKEGKMDLEKIFTILHQYDSGITEILINGEANIADDYKLMPNGWSTSFLKNLKLFRQTVFPHNEFSKGVIDKLNDVVIDKTSMLPDIKHVYIKNY